jgi:hypothetical protein
MAVRAEYESVGVPIIELRACDPEGPGGTQLERCMKVYVPVPAGTYGMVFQIGRRSDGKCSVSPTWRLGFDIRAQTYVSRRSTRSHTDGCTLRLHADYDANSSLNSDSIRERRIARLRTSASSRT